MTDADNVVDITQCEFQKFVGQNGPGVGESEQ
jgi:hypothetical protein